MLGEMSFHFCICFENVVVKPYSPFQLYRWVLQDKNLPYITLSYLTLPFSVICVEKFVESGSDGKINLTFDCTHYL